MPNTSASPWAERSSLLALALALLAFAVFAPALGYDFVGLDDDVYITANPHLALGLSGAGISWAFSSIYAGFWHPLVWLVLLGIHQFFGTDPTAYHAVQILLHAGSTALFFLALRRLGIRVWVAFVSAGLFALHPLRMESVIWLAEMKDVLSVFFWMLATYCYAGYARKKTPLAYGLTCLAAVLGFMAKPMLVTLPFAFLLLDYWPLNRWNIDTWRGTLPKLVTEKLPLFLLSFGFAYLAYTAEHSWGALPPHHPLTERLATMVTAYGTYLWQTLVPVGLSPYYTHPGMPPAGEMLISLTALAALTAFVLVKLRSLPGLAVGWFWFLGTLFPVSGIVQISAFAHADRFTYIPHAGLFLALCLGADELRTRYNVSGQAALGTGLALMLACGGLTLTTQAFWRSPETLYPHMLSLEPDNPVAQTNLGVHFYKKNDYKTAARHFRKALERWPGYTAAKGNLGLSLYELGAYQEAHGYLAAAVKERPTPKFRKFYGLTLARAGEYDAAKRELTAVLEARPNDHEAWTYLANVHVLTGNGNDAAEAFRKALEIKPDTPQALAGFGALLLTANRPKDALTYLERAEAESPNMPGVRQRIQAARKALGE